ncbi:MAG: 2-oxo-4-hydroxy-4-carboxy-5-ureidoimidazoline decarboxylase, partial [Actinomycetota bacterium]
AEEFLAAACASMRWVEAMAGARPFEGATSVLEAADAAFGHLGPRDWLEAFAAHPRIGERQGRQGEAAEAMSRSEQGGVDRADEALSAELAEVNRRYEDRFGYTYIVRAAGRSGEEMLEMARSRLQNSPEEELEVAAGQQRQITRLRLASMLCIEEAK